jgi:trimeric autotransporter adhesin
MATEIQLKRSYTPGQIPGASNVLVGEPVINLVDRVLYTKDNSGNIVVISSGNASTIASLAFNAANVAAAYTVAGVAGNVSNIQLASGITSSGLLTTANISELTNLYFTNARARESITVATGNVNGKGSYNSATGVISINAANVTVSSSAPTNPYVGDLWINADTAVEYLFFGDGDSYQWVEIGTPGSGGSGTTITVAGVTGDVSNVQLVSGISQTGILTTANVTEVNNLYFTNARAVASLTAGQSITIDANGRINSTATGSTYGDSNVALLGYATNANVALKANVADLKTANVAEVTSLYFTNARAIAAITNTSLSNLTVSGNVTATNFVGNISITGNLVGTSANVSLVAGSYTATFDNTGNLTIPGTFVGSGSSLTGVALTTTGSWTVTTGTNTYSITVPSSGTYQIWVRGNIPNGIIAYSATAVVTNTNVPVVGVQYAWVYNGGGSPIDFTSIPNQFIGTANTIVRSSVAPSATTNRFDFGINNSSGSSQTVYWGYVTL